MLNVIEPIYIVFTDSLNNPVQVECNYKQDLDWYIQNLTKDNISYTLACSKDAALWASLELIK